MLHTTSSIREWGCRRRYRYKYIDRVRVVTKGKALNVGNAIHYGLEGFQAGLSEEEMLASLAEWATDEYWQTENGQVEYHRARAMLRAYYWRWADTRKDWASIAIEKEFEISLAQGVQYAGKIDYVARHIPSDNRLYIWDHKTTSDDIANVGTDYWQKLAIDKQITAYSEAMDQAHGERPAVLWDVLRKPAGKPKMKKKIGRRKTETDEEYEARKAEVMETLDEFEQRLYETMIEEKDKYLVQREVYRTNDQHAEALAELIEECLEIQNYKGTYTRNDALCQARYGACPYLGVCVGVETLDSEKFVQLDVLHPELDDNTGGQDEFADCPI